MSNFLPWTTRVALERLVSSPCFDAWHPHHISTWRHFCQWGHSIKCRYVFKPMACCDTMTTMSLIGSWLCGVPVENNIYPIVFATCPFNLLAFYIILRLVWHADVQIKNYLQVLCSRSFWPKKHCKTSGVWKFVTSQAETALVSSNIHTHHMKANQGPVSLTVFPSQFKFNGNFVSLSPRL